VTPKSLKQVKGGSASMAGAFCSPAKAYATEFTASHRLVTIRDLALTPPLALTPASSGVFTGAGTVPRCNRKDSSYQDNGDKKDKPPRFCGDKEDDS
jgi:hypothetical protein